MVVLVFAWGTQKQIDVWRGPESLWRYAVEVFPGKLGLVHRLMGDVFRDECRLLEAEAQFQLALGINPNILEAYNGLGLIYLTQKRFPEAEAAFQGALKVQPDYEFALNNLGIVYVYKEQLNKAENAFK